MKVHKAMIVRYQDGCQLTIGYDTETDMVLIETRDASDITRFQEGLTVDQWNTIVAQTNKSIKGL